MKEINKEFIVLEQGSDFVMVVQRHVYRIYIHEYPRTKENKAQIVKTLKAKNIYKRKL